MEKLESETEASWEAQEPDSQENIAANKRQEPAN